MMKIDWRRNRFWRHFVRNDLLSNCRVLMMSVEIGIRNTLWDIEQTQVIPPVHIHVESSIIPTHRCPVAPDKDCKRQENWDGNRILMKKPWVSLNLITRKKTRVVRTWNEPTNWHLKQCNHSILTWKKENRPFLFFKCIWTDLISQMKRGRRRTVSFFFIAVLFAVSLCVCVNNKKKTNYYRYLWILNKFSENKKKIMRECSIYTWYDIYFFIRRNRHANRAEILRVKNKNKEKMNE